MHLNQDRQGITATVDAMIFIVLMGLAVTAITLADEQPAELPRQEAAELSDAVFLGSITAAEFGLPVEGTRVYAIADLTAASLQLGDDTAATYLAQLLDIACGHPAAYRLICSYENTTIYVGIGGSALLSGFEGDYRLEYGGMLHVRIQLF